MSNVVVETRSAVVRLRGNHWTAARCIELIAAAGVLAAVLAVAAPAWMLLNERPGQDQTVNRLLLACQQGFQRGPLAAVGAAAGATAALWGAAVLCRLAWRAFRDFRAMRQLRALLEGLVAGGTGRDGAEAIVVATADRVAFTSGLLRPRVYVGAGMVDGLGPMELRAVLLHERSHQRAFDPLRCWLVELALAGAFGRFARPLCAYYLASREAAADRFAVGVQGDDRPLLRAIALADPFRVVAGACALAAERQESLRRLRHIDAALPHRRAAAIVCTLVLLGVLIGLAVAGLGDWQGYWFCPGGVPIPP